MSEGESVSMTAVPEARTLKLVFAAMPCASLPSQLPASDCNFLKAVAEWVPAQRGAAMAAANNSSVECVRRVTDASLRESAPDLGNTKVWRARFRRFDDGIAGREAGVRCQVRSGKGRVSRFPLFG